MSASSLEAEARGGLLLSLPFLYRLSICGRAVSPGSRGIPMVLLPHGILDPYRAVVSRQVLLRELFTDANWGGRCFIATLPCLVFSTRTRVGGSGGCFRSSRPADVSPWPGRPRRLLRREAGRAMGCVSALASRRRRCCSLFWRILQSKRPTGDDPLHGAATWNRADCILLMVGPLPGLGNDAESRDEGRPKAFLHLTGQCWSGNTTAVIRDPTFTFFLPSSRTSNSHGAPNHAAKQDCR